MTKLLVIFFPLFFLTSCASYFVKRDCEKTDWYQYGQKAALAGRRLSGDHAIRVCRDAGAEVDDVALDHGFKQGLSNYCEPETVFQNGKKGEFFNEDMCEQSASLRRQHTEGVRLFCRVSNAFAAGATGTKYNGICPKDLELAFIPEFNRGRKSYLNAMIAANESAIGDAEVQIGRLESQKFMFSSQLMALPPESAQTAVIVTDPYTGQTVAQGHAIDASLQAQRNNIESQIQATESELYQQRQLEQSLRVKNRELRVEMTLL